MASDSKGGIMKKKTAHVVRKSTTSVSKKDVSMLASEEMRGFLVHFILYLLVNFGLFVYMYSRSENMSLFYWVLGGWGIGLVAHVLSVLGFMKFLAKEW